MTGGKGSTPRTSVGRIFPSNDDCRTESYVLKPRKWNQNSFKNNDIPFLRPQSISKSKFLKMGVQNFFYHFSFDYDLD